MGRTIRQMEAEPWNCLEIEENLEKQAQMKYDLNISKWIYFSIAGGGGKNMTKEEWIQDVVSHIDDTYQREAIARQLEEKLAKKMIKQRNEYYVLKQLGTPEEYYEKHYSRKSSKKFNLIAGGILILVGILLLFINIFFADNLLFSQSVRGIKNGVFYSSGLILGIGILVLIGGLRTSKK